MTDTKSACPYCGVGCGVIIESQGDQITGVRGDPDHPANFGRLCTKGSTLHLTATAAVIRDARLRHPELRASRDLPRTKTTWDTALDHVADRFAEIIAEHGPDAVAFYISGQLLTEDYYVFNKLAKGLIGTNNVDTNSRLCMSSAVAGYKQTLGADAPPNCYEDFDHADLLLIAGSNMAYAHPILYRRIEDARKRAAEQGAPMRTIVVDPRRTDTAREADLHLAILPGTDVALFNGLLHLCLWDDRIATGYIEAHTEGWADLKRLVRDYTPRFVATTCGISEEDLSTAARWFGEAKAALSLYCQGLNQSASGTAKNAALINLHLATGHIGRPGAGPFSLTGQPNAMGGREVGGMANLLSAHRDLKNPEHRAEVAALWGIDDVPATKGKTAVELFDAIADGTVKAVWIACTNPLQSMPEQGKVHAALMKAELVVLQECFATTATAPYADVLLPAATWGEKDGSVTNSERRISRVRKAVAPPGTARDDWAIVCDFARRLETRLRPGRPTLFPYADVESVWNEHRETTRGRDLDITGLSYAILDERGPQLWPFASGATEGRKRLYEDGVFPTPSGRARFVVTPYKPVVDTVDARYPFALNTGRLRDQWHGMSRTGSVPQLFGHSAEPGIDLSETDAKRRLMNDGDFVQVSSRRGSQVLRVRVSDTMRAGQAFVAMHWGEEFVGGMGERHGVNTLTSPAFDPDSLQPELKHAAVRLVKLDLPWRVVAFAWVEPDAVASTMERLRAHFGRFAYASCVPFGRAGSEGDGADNGATKIGVLFRAAHDDALDVPTVEAIEAALGMGVPARHARAGVESHLLRYDDPRRGHARRVLVQDGTLRAVSLRGDWSAELWLKEYLEAGLPVAQLGRLLLKPGTTAPSGFKSRGRIVCNCWNVGESEIVAMLEQVDGTPPARLGALQTKLKCGTQCGSCLPEVKRLIAETRGTVSA
jgi:assimilatory nitrate reductase catalytic subunit